ncbi:MAG: hypothetical protein AAB495_00010 [Patescibacteria group bacterium]
MPDQVPQFEHAALEADMNRLAAEIAGHRENPEIRASSEQDLLRLAIRAVAQAPIQTIPRDDSQKSQIPAYATSASSEVKLEIEYLVDLAIHQGIGKANEMAMKSNPFVLDAFHDALAGKLYPEFQKRGVLK